MRERRLIYSTLVGVALIAAACASSIRVRTDYDRDVNFKRYRTFAFREGNSSGNPVMDQRIRADVTAALKARGMDEVRPENADTMVVAHAATRTRRTYDTFYDGWGWRYRWARPTVVVNEFDVGTIVVDMFDNESKTAVWHGYASRVLHDDPEKDAEQTDRAVRQIFEQYPA
jgi:uncharacterized protein DUF4136